MSTYFKTNKCFFKILTTIILLINVIDHVKGYDYYWRDYDGETIPSDALEVGKGSGTYIAQVYVYYYGIYVGTLRKGQDFLEVSAYGDKKPTKNIKILCTDVSDNPPEDMWLRTTSENFHLDTIGQNPIIGGYASVQHQYENIGRVTHGSSLVAGNLASFDPAVHLYYAYGGQEFTASTYEVLVNPRQSNNKI